MPNLDKRITIGITYFNDGDYLQDWIKQIELFPNLTEVIIVDDGSQDEPITFHLDAFKRMPEWAPDIKVYRVPDDLGFNSHGCRNLIAKVAETPLLQFFDIDMLMYPPTIGRMLRTQWREDAIYHHSFFNSFNQKMWGAWGHMNCFLIHKDLYWKAGGYDESFTGHHWGDREFLDRIYKIAEKRMSSEVMYLRRKGKHGHVDPDVSKTVYYSKTQFAAPIGPDEIKKLVGTNNNKICFNYERIL